MKNIILANPVVVSFAEGISDKAKEDIKDLVKYRKCLCITDGVANVEAIQNENKGTLTGVEVARAYCWLLGIPFQTVTSINVEDIAVSCDNLDHLLDIIYLAYRVDMRNKRLKKLQEMEAPEIIIRNECRMLQERVEQLAFNCKSENPVTRDTEEGKVALASLRCIGYEL